MAKRAEGLSALKIKNMREPGMYADGGGLYLCVRSGSAKSWIFRYSNPEGKRREMGIGSLDSLTLVDARAKVRDLRMELSGGRDPIVERIIQKDSGRARALTVRTFEQVANEYIDDRCQGWDHSLEVRWRGSLKKHVFPKIGNVLVSDITPELIIQVLLPLFREKKTETGQKVQRRISRILGYARAVKYYSGDNPAIWKDNLDHALSDFVKKRERSNLPSVPYQELPDFYAKLVGKADPSHRALRAAILTLGRSAEIREATFSEFDLERRTWRLSPERMKAKEEHVVPLSKAMIEIFHESKATAESNFLFPGRIWGRPLSDMAMNMVMRRYGRNEVQHGFRSTFKVWVSECTEYPDDLSEFALAHKIPEKVKAAYKRTTMLEKRRQLMEDWAAFVTSKVK